MRSRLISLAVAALLLVAPHAARAICGASLIYFYDEDYYGDGFGDCGGELLPGAPLIVHVLLESFDFPQSISEINFRVNDWIGSPGEPLGQVTEHWTADQVDGSLAEGITLHWEDGLAPTGGNFYDLGYLEIEAYSADWVAAGHVVHPTSLQYTDVEGWSYDGFDDGGDTWSSRFTFNGGDMCTTFILDPDTWRVVRHFLPEDGASVPSVFPFEFQVACVYCLGWFPCSFDGSVSLGGEQITEFTGEGVQEFSVMVDASDYPVGSTIQVELHVDYGSGHDRDYQFEYTVSDVVSTHSLSVSVLKGLYR